MCFLEWGKISFDLIKAFLWPSAFVFACLYFREDLKSMASRVTEAGLSKLVFTPPSQQPVPQQTPTVPPDSAGPSEGSGTKPLAGVTESIARIKASVSAEQLEPQFQNAKRDMPADVLRNPQETIDFLLYASVALSIQLGHERTYRSIFGSQMTAMLKMNTVGGIDRAAVQAVYDAAAEAYPSMYPSNMSFDRWMEFLTVSGLVEVNAAGRFFLTATGRGFLRYILDNKLNPEKPF